MRGIALSMHFRPWLIFAAVVSLAVACGQPPSVSTARVVEAAAPYAVAEKTVDALQQDLALGRVTAQQLVASYLARIAAFDRQGPMLRSVIALNPQALEAARRSDVERAAGRLRGPLHGIPVLLKDNIESADPTPTTAGSLALAHNVTGRDAPIVERLRAAGAIILGKTNLSEWANMRSTHATSGWSAVGGITQNPYAIGRNPCGSSSGSGAAVAANLAALAVGTETDGSITCPASVLGLVGLKPTLGLVSRTRIIPISSHQDTAGPMARTVSDAARLLTVLAGPDPADSATQAAAEHAADYAAQLSKDALAGKRLGIVKAYSGFLPQVDRLFEAAIAQLRAAGAQVEELTTTPELAAIGNAEHAVLATDFRQELNAYLATTPPTVATRNLADLIAFNREHAAEELVYFEQELFVEAEATASHDAAAHALRAEHNRQVAARILETWLSDKALDALIAPTIGPAWTTDVVNGDHVLGGASMLPAVAGFPHLSVPMGQVAGLPVGLSWIGRPWSDALLLQLGYAYEQRSQLRKAPQCCP